MADADNVQLMAKRGVVRSLSFAFCVPVRQQMKALVGQARAAPATLLPLGVAAVRL